MTSFVGHHAGIEVTDAGLLPGLALTDLFDLALRVNPKRPHLLVSTGPGQARADGPTDRPWQRTSARAAGP